MGDIVKAEPGALAPAQRRSLVATLAAQYEMEPGPFMDAIAQTVMPTDRQVSNAMIAAFLMVCHEHGLNPFTREIFAFPTKTGGIQPIVSVDGWVKLVNRHPQFAGMDMTMVLGENGKPVSATCTIFRKDREHQTPVTEYYDECYRNTDPWNKMPRRMMRHKALKEAARYTFGFAGIMDEDEAREREAINVTGMVTEISRVVEEKTGDAKENLKKRLTAAKTAPATPPAAAPAATVPLEEDPDLASLAANAPATSSPAMDHAKEVMAEKAAAEGVQAQAEAPTPAAICRSVVVDIAVTLPWMNSVPCGISARTLFTRVS